MILQGLVRRASSSAPPSPGDPCKAVGLGKVWPGVYAPQSELLHVIRLACLPSPSPDRAPRL